MSPDCMEQPLFDVGQIELLRVAMGPDDLNAMLSELPEHALQSQGAIETALASDNLDEACRVAHVLKGVASSFGAARLAAIAAAMELESPSVASLRRRMPALVETIRSTAAAMGELTF